MNIIFYKRIAIIFLIISLVSLIPSLLFYEFGLQKSYEWNKNAVQIICTIMNSYIKKDQCNMVCYDGFIYVTYIAENQTVGKVIQVDFDQTDYATVKNNLEDNYPIGKQLTCYYDKDNIFDVKINLSNPKIFIYLIIVFMVIGGVIFIGWSITEYKEIRLKYYKYVQLHNELYNFN